MSTTSTIPAAAVRLARRQAGLLSVLQCEELGIGRDVRRRMVRQGRWSSPARGVVDTDPVPLDGRVRDDWFRHAAWWRTWFALLVHGPDAVATGCCALVLHGVAGLPRDFPLEVAREDGSPRRTRYGVPVVLYEPFPVVSRSGRTVAQLDHAAAQALPRLSRQNALAVLDDLARSHGFDPDRLAALHELVRRRRGAARLHELFPLVDPRSESPAESFARLSCIDNGVPPDSVQAAISHRGRIIARVDFLWRLPDGRYLVVEIDGVGPHSTPQALVRDAPRQNQLLATGRVIMLRFKPADNARPGGVGAQIAATLRAHGWTRPTSATRQPSHHAQIHPGSWAQ
ncbi:hypothetical protein ACFQHV_15990 [Promicromonospora thailandica]|uniref:DUF559 domain-containing protein n=1 Tax=Promicromonospora thailandica TaxID=765201 RepID=A0A9X2G7J6_9MICO|nr:hypothetical protein [Promicromonospora thailandica]MCP2264669.1 hypothetical protein [Promicromonospora thailandica]BFF20254.1 hypothetical protein GCM10025730_37750 [Promicromonospora thailandica]